LLLVLTGCVAPAPPPEPEAESSSPQIRFSSEGLARGLVEPVVSMEDLSGQESEGGRAPIVAQDLDADGDVDLLVGHLALGPVIYENDGDGRFTNRGQPWDLEPVPSWPWIPDIASAVRSVGVAAVDLDGDGLPEVVSTSFGSLIAFANRGELEFAPPVVLHEDPTPGRLFLAQFGDVDGDGRLDLLVPTQQVDAGDGPPLAAHDLLLAQPEGGYELLEQLRVEPGGSDSQTAILSDLDGDALPDPLIWMDQGSRSGIFTHAGVDSSGAPQFEDRAVGLGLDLYMNAMGVDVADLNGDGAPDYVVTVLGPPLLFLSGDGAFTESGAARGLAPVSPIGQWGTVGWSLSLADLDNNRTLDIAQASGRAYETTGGYPDLVWSADGDGGYTDVSAAAGVGSTTDHYGLATADLDGDGCLDMVFTGPGEPPELLMGDCGSGAWIELDLAGPPGNAEGFGAWVEVTSAGGVQGRELLNLRSEGQEPSLVHVGLGDDVGPVDVRVRWPGGLELVAVDLPVRQRIQLRHPDTLVPELPSPWSSAPLL